MRPQLLMHRHLIRLFLQKCITMFAWCDPTFHHFVSMCIGFSKAILAQLDEQLVNSLDLSADGVEVLREKVHPGCKLYFLFALCSHFALQPHRALLIHEMPLAKEADQTRTARASCAASLL